MTRLGHRAAEDDLQFFYKYLSSRWWDIESLRVTKQDQIAAVQTTPETTSDDRSRNHRSLSMDILFQIAATIDSPQTLFNFAITSKVTMMASIPRLRYPQFVSQYPGSRWRFCPDGAIFSSRIKDSELFPTAFELVHEEGLAFLQVMTALERGAVTVAPPVNLCKSFPRKRRTLVVGGEDLYNW